MLGRSWALVVEILEISDIKEDNREGRKPFCMETDLRLGTYVMSLFLQVRAQLFAQLLLNCLFDWWFLFFFAIARA